MRQITKGQLRRGSAEGRIAAAGTSVMLPVVAFSILVRNYLVRGLAARGVKE
jgi:multiple sugar transport system permease protein